MESRQRGKWKWKWKWKLKKLLVSPPRARGVVNVMPGGKTR